MKWLAATTILGVLVVSQARSTQRADMHEEAAATYEHLANAIIAIRQTENQLVRGILLHHEAMAAHQLSEAAEAAPADRKKLCEDAALQIAHLANEGDKRVQAIRQRLLKAGHHHHTDAETNEDYIFIDSKEKQRLLAFARKVGSMGEATSAADLRAAADELAKIVSSAMASD